MSNKTGDAKQSVLRSLLGKKTVSPLGSCRRVTHSDQEYLESLIDKSSQNLFGDVDLQELLSKCLTSLCVFNEEGQAVALICVDDCPNVPSIPPWEWNHWLFNLYRLEQTTPRNSLWIKLVAWNKNYTDTFLKPLLRHLFKMVWYLEYVLMVVPPGIAKVDWLDQNGTLILPEGCTDAKKTQKIYLIVRQQYMPKYKVRRAVEEDNDDLVPLIHAYSERLQKIYGEFYIAEMITRHPDAGRQLIVAEHDEMAVAVFCLNETVNYDALNESYELAPFCGLRKPHEADTFDHPELTQQASVPVITTLDWTDEDGQLSGIVSNGEEYAHVSLETEMSDEVEIMATRIPSQDSLDDYSIVNISSMHLLGDEPEESKQEPVQETESQFSVLVLSFNEYEMHLFSHKSNTCSIEQFCESSSKQTKNQAYFPSVPLYYGEGNSFTLELAAAAKAHECEALELLLEASFECFPDRDYCIITVPSQCPPFPLMKHFIRAIPRPKSTYAHELYIVHRNSITSDITVRVAVRSDLQVIEEMVSKVMKSGPFLADFTSAVDNEDSEYYAYIILSEDQPVGASVIREEDDMEYLKTHYELLQWLVEHVHKAGSHGVVEHVILSPIFQRHSRFFLREMHRLSDFSALYYYINPSDAISAKRERCLASILGYMVPVQPRPQNEFCHTNLEGCEPAEVVHRVDPPFALYLSTKQICTLPRMDLNTRIVVVGSSDVSIAFLESLLCTSDQNLKPNFTNVTVVAPHGLAYQQSPLRVRDMLFVKKSNLCNRRMLLYSLRTHVNIVNGVLTAIDRKDKTITISDDSFLPYDMLFLMCGQQYQKPPSKTAPKDKRLQRNEFPENVFLINTETDAQTALSKLKTLTYGKSKYTVVVYGYSLDAYCCLAALLEYGVKGANIMFVEPFPVLSSTETQHDSTFFNDGDIDEAVVNAIKDEGITIYPSYYFLEWTYDGNENKIVSAKFESKHKMLDVKFVAMFMYGEKSVSARTFLAIIRSGLVFDGALVIGPDCKTNDPYIYAAGTFTKYSRRYYAEHLAHKHYNMEEIGYNLGQQIRNKLMPQKERKEKTDMLVCNRGPLLVPRYIKPLVTYCNLPGNLRYLYITKPGKQVPLERAMNSDKYGQDYITGECTTVDRQGFFRLHLNQYNVVETITCLAKFDVDRQNLTSVWGKHEKLLNNLVMRFEMVLITDFFEFFREPWICAIYHDRFPGLDNSIYELMTTLTNTVGDSVLEDLIKMFNENKWKALNKLQQDEIEEKFTDSPYYTMVEQKILDFLKDNMSFLPMYAHPIIVNLILQGYENSPLFAEQ